MFVNDWDSGPYVNSAGLDYTAVPNEYGTVDILSASAGALSTAPADVVANFYQGADPIADNPNPYTFYSIDITGLVALGGTYQIRFGEADNQSFFNQGIDNVSITATAIPEPSTLLLFGTGLAGVGLLRRRFKG
jgi:hypothetical protein